MTYTYHAACREKAGTYAGARRHQTARQELCEPCRRARNAYRAERRSANPGYRDTQTVRTRAWKRALADLRARHSAEFDELYRRRLAEEWSTR